MLNKFLKVSALAIFAGFFTSSAIAQSAAEFYKGKSIKWIVPYKPGGGYDEYSRLLAPFVEKYSGARVDIANMPGAGGMKGANEIFKSPADGLTVGIINGSAMVTNELAEIKGADYQVSQYNFLGRVAADVRVLVTGSDNDYADFDSLLNASDTFNLGATGLGGSTYVDAVITGKVFGLNQKVIHGFNSSSDVRQALLRGDIHGMWGSLGSALKGVKAGQHRIVLQSGSERSAELPDVPTVTEVAKGLSDPAAAEAVLNAWDALNQVGRPVAAPPGVAEDRVAFLQDVFGKAMNDPEFIDVAKQAKRALSYSTGTAMADTAKASTDLTDDVRTLLVSAIRGEL